MDKKLNRHRWLTAGLQALAEGGPETLRIMPIAEQLQVTKGSFYWHFKSLEDYRTAVLEEWERHYTGDAIASLDHDRIDSREKLRTWIVGATYADLRLERAVRSWALNNPVATTVRQRVDAERIDFLIKLLCGVGWPLETARTLGQWAYCAWLGYAILDEVEFTDHQLGLILSRLIPD
ncbi:TetR/AcrR family transcriptional regulator [Noviherbaspirillum sp. CPCC 100848]|uniref:TetR/AcrR family transcriptional regulator n=1 Tax=Noviherbaspirillum album TaxID=3080276 RepID=A0ABU6JKA3_9BURK|nr:TetR/AcrR family transcriptional regulator [Noviherbaspirillum sp. CPCC 100848]MEC4723539.1 TetR/AcrR family transcriptional regulator [Noviherbaspirillum sp. CPCC 100848]